MFRIYSLFSKPCLVLIWWQSNQRRGLPFPLAGLTFLVTQTTALFAAAPWHHFLAVHLGCAQVQTSPLTWMLRLWAGHWAVQSNLLLLLLIYFNFKSFNSFCIFFTPPPEGLGIARWQGTFFGIARWQGTFFVWRTWKRMPRSGHFFGLFAEPLFAKCSWNSVFLLWYLKTPFGLPQLEIGNGPTQCVIFLTSWKQIQEHTKVWPCVHGSNFRLQEFSPDALVRQWWRWAWWFPSSENERGPPKTASGFFWIFFWIHWFFFINFLCWWFAICETILWCWKKICFLTHFWMGFLPS